MALPKDWKEWLECLNSNSVDYVLVGAFAVMYHSVPRTTIDIDVLVRPAEWNAERVLAALRDFGFGSLKLTSEDFTTPGRVVQLGTESHRHPHDDQRRRDRRDLAGRVAGRLEGVPVWFLGRDALIKNKRAAGRLKDLRDLEEMGLRQPGE
ncbi:MAG: hypothetical protein SFV18_04075 [Bryobacteraceae bacterium]|nr:hypothetical protein [Bryobacteraceae bacterium]